jgi:hypothetical protein
MAILRRAGNCCEGAPHNPGCRAENGQPHPVTGSKVVLTISHLDHNPQNNAPENLRALCQACHLSHDRHEHAENRRLRRRASMRDGKTQVLPLTEERSLTVNPVVERARRTGERVRLENRMGQFVATVYVPPFQPVAEVLCWGMRFFVLHEDPPDPKRPRTYREGMCYHVLAHELVEYAETEDGRGTG